MKIIEVYSHLNGLEYLLIHKPKLWEEIQNVIMKIDAEICRTKVSKEKRTMDKLLFSPIAMNLEFKTLLRSYNWAESRVGYLVTKNEKLIRKTLSMSPDEQRNVIAEAGETPIYSYNQTDFIIERVTIEVQFGKYSFVA
ncbi:MAG: BglII/BstYI family type II restriction endonuclease [Leptolinea sp.]